MQARVDLLLRPPSQRDLSIEVVVDTGFEGALTLPAAGVAALGLPYHTRLDAHLADGSLAHVPVHVATIVWDGQETQVAVLAMGNRLLLGTALLDGFSMRADFESQGSLEIRRLSP